MATDPWWPARRKGADLGAGRARHRGEGARQVAGAAGDHRHPVVEVGDGLEEREERPEGDIAAEIDVHPQAEIIAFASSLRK